LIFDKNRRQESGVRIQNPAPTPEVGVRMDAQNGRGVEKGGKGSAANLEIGSKSEIGVVLNYTYLHGITRIYTMFLAVNVTQVENRRVGKNCLVSCRSSWLGGCERMQVQRGVIRTDRAGKCG